MGTQQTFDQLLTSRNTDPIDCPDQFHPHTIVESRIVFEPLPEQCRLRITARTADYRLLWGVIASRGIISQHPVPVAAYEALTKIARDKMPDTSGREIASDAITSAISSAKALIAQVEILTEKITVKKASDATRARAELYSAAFRDAKKLIETYISEYET